MITAVDTSVLLDVFGASPRFGQVSAQALRRCLNEGALVACEAVWAETRVAFADKSRFELAMQTLGVDFCASSQDAASQAGAMFKSYREAGGQRDRVIADFLIGAHAAQQCDR